MKKFKEFVKNHRAEIIEEAVRLSYYTAGIAAGIAIGKYAGTKAGRLDVLKAHEPILRLIDGMPLDKPVHAIRTMTHVGWAESLEDLMETMPK